jgi:DNA-binding transcriptional ArsR family regulator
MELSRPFAVITPTLDGDVLRVLALANADFTSGDIHRLLDGPSIRGIHNTLGRLTEQGIVHRHLAGRTNIYRLNREHLAAPYVIGVARIRDELLDRLGIEVRGWSVQPLVGALFGSGARRDHTSASDIDILLVRPDVARDDVWDSQTDSLSALVTTWTGNDCRILTFTESQIMPRRAAEPVLEDIIREGVAFHGDIQWLASAVQGGHAGRGRGGRKPA